MNIKKILKKYFSKQDILDFTDRYERLKYPELQTKYDNFILEDNIWVTVEKEKIKTPDLLAALTKESSPIKSKLCQSFVFMYLEDEAEKLTAERYKKAVLNNDDKELEDIFVNYDSNGIFRQNYINSNIG